MFYVELKPKNNNKDIYEVFRIQNKFESPHPKRMIPQLIASGITQKVFAFVKRNTSRAQNSIQSLTVHAGRNPRMSNVIATSQLITKIVWSIRNYKRIFSPHYGEK